MYRQLFSASLLFSVFLLPVQAQQPASGPEQTAATSAAGNTSEPAAAEKLIIGTKVAAPFVLKTETGEFEGISIELWRNVAAQMGIEYEFRESDLPGLLNGLQDGSLDASVAALTVTAPREDVIDFTHPFYTTGLAIAVPQQGNRVWAAIKRFFSWEFFTALVALGSLLLVVGAAVWLFERRGNPDEFGGKTSRGLGAGFWWAAVTMTTVGYGDKSPRTLGGRIIALIWMFAAIIIISGFTAAIATSLTVSQLETTVQGVDDLPNVRVSTVADSASSDFLDHRGIRSYSEVSLEDSLAALANGKADAVVYDAPILMYLSNQEFPKRTAVLPNEFDRQDYAIALPAGSQLREPMNRAILEFIGSDEWEQILSNYLGEQ